MIYTSNKNSDLMFFKIHIKKSFSKFVIYIYRKCILIYLSIFSKNIYKFNLIKYNFKNFLIPMLNYVPKNDNT